MTRPTRSGKAKAKAARAKTTRTTKSSGLVQGKGHGGASLQPGDVIEAIDGISSSQVGYMRAQTLLNRVCNTYLLQVRQGSRRFQRTLGL